MSEPLNSLLKSLNTHPKSLVIEKSLSTAINFITPFSKLKELANIQNVYWFNDPLTVSSSNSTTFLIKSNLSNIPILSQRIHELISNDPTHKINVITTLDYFKSFKHELNKIGIYGELQSLTSWNLYIHDPTSNSIQLYISELNSLYLYKTPNIPYKLANWLNEYLIINPNLQITHILSKGLNSSKFTSIFKNLRNDYKNSLSPLEKKLESRIEKGLYGSSSNNSGKQTDLIVLERNLDFLSVLLNQLSYSGLIDEVYDIDINTIKLDSTTYLDSENDSIYNSLKFMNFGIACDYLNNEAKSLQLQYDELNNLNDLSHIKNFVDKLNELELLKKQVSNHTKISEEILNKLQTSDESSNYNTLLEFQQDILFANLSYSNIISKIIELINYQEYQLYDILRLISITSIVNNGLRERDYITLNNEILESFGFKYFQLLQNLIKIGLITIRGDPSIIKNFNNLNSKLKLTSDIDDDPNNPSEPSFAYRGYIPLISRILQNSIHPNKRSSWSHLDLNSLLLGKTIDEELTQDNIGLGGLLQKNDSMVIIVMIGGLTYSELATIKFVERQFKEKYGINKKFMVLTDSFINAKDLFDSNL
ncbi:hypothetical protein WICANDRAFT_78958 [Wickerhamomyces anomalus NRRL Y-366-8]|uniref:Sec1-like protein n=1 Tax=Wickerhamomyces anomalus (strain ATCC 58044 / CBS 1984 / NCYC 433 / NRRL Y-366-8) TaxID=683960 RepID=A0A1E3P4W7_WICAA|nr:uncharacterized protein WICANDRAFT_78958 [Wickerhamomyces anomalus NRRL Y-366-8]ODQ60358.1 hypothetical protein WICANDRAFT_78958 [Wickerhamomyces anomalus NRRL Y-366-8]